jgi:hypothetical protein
VVRDAASNAVVYRLEGFLYKPTWARFMGDGKHLIAGSAREAMCFETP